MLKQNKNGSTWKKQDNKGATWLKQDKDARNGRNKITARHG